MKTFEVSFEFEKKERDTFGFPVFGTKTMEIVAANEESIRVRFDRWFGRGNYNIVSSEVINSTDAK